MATGPRECLTRAGLKVGVLIPATARFGFTPYGPVAQPIEHPDANREVAGEYPAGTTFCIALWFCLHKYSCGESTA